jgi:histidine triad (HIT) family protein
MPMDKLHETDLVIAFRHPSPTHQIHVVLVQKRPVKTLMHLGPEDADVLADVFLTIQKIVTDLGLEREGYSVVVNGGPRQDVEQIHFHVLSGDELRA